MHKRHQFLHSNYPTAKLAATGPARGAVSKVLEGSVGKAAHIIIPPSDLAGGFTPMATQGGKEAGSRYFATALFFAPSRRPPALITIVGY